MIRYSLFILTVIGTTATAIAAINPGAEAPVSSANVTVIEKNQFWPIEGELVVEKCAVEDCSDTPQG